MGGAVPPGGCVQASLGVESADEGVRRGGLGKRFTNHQLRRAVTELRRAGLALPL